MNKIRINELARELEVKSHEIIDRLPELGVTEKKTHSSSIDEDVALKLRRIFGHEGPQESAGAVPERAPERVPAATPEAEQPAATVETLPVSEAAPSSPASQPSAIEERAPAGAPGTPTIDRPAGRPAHPIRPPLAGSAPPSASPAAPAPPSP